MDEFRIETLTPWIELLCEAGDARARDRLLLEGVLALGLADAAAIWRRGTDGAWRQHVARGPADLLPRESDVTAVAERRLAFDTLAARRVHVSNGVALALGGVTQEHDQLDVAEALLATYALVTAGSDADVWPAPLPVRKRHATPRNRPSGSEEARRVQHDLRNALTSLRATEDLLARFADGLSEDESEKFRTAVERECSRAGALLAQGLCAQGLALPVSGSADGAPNGTHGLGAIRSEATSRPAQVVEQVLEAEHAASVRAGIETRVLIDPAVRGRVCAITPQRLARVVQNLLVNARQALLRDASAPTVEMVPRARTASGCVWLTLELARDARVPSLVLLVEDDGPGIGPHDLERVFAPGYTTRKGEGSGSGLAIVRSLVEAAGGSACAEVRVLGGARVRVFLPLERDDATASSADP